VAQRKYYKVIHRRNADGQFMSSYGLMNYGPYLPVRRRDGTWRAGTETRRMAVEPQLCLRGFHAWKSLEIALAHSENDELIFECRLLGSVVTDTYEARNSAGQGIQLIRLLGRCVEVRKGGVICDSFRPLKRIPGR
jgi:hypothetical protein